MVFSLEIEMRNILAVNTSTRRRQKGKKERAILNASKISTEAAAFALSVVRNLSIIHVKRHVQFSTEQKEERRIHQLKRFHHSEGNQAAKEHRERMIREQHKHHHHHRSTRGRKSGETDADSSRMKKKQHKVHDVEHERRKQEAMKRRKRAAKERQRKKKEKSSAAAAAAELRLEMTRHAISNAVRVAFESVRYAEIAATDADRVARNALESVRKHAVRIAKSAARAANNAASNSHRLVLKMNAMRDASYVAMCAALSAANMCLSLEEIVQEAEHISKKSKDVLKQKQEEIMSSTSEHLSQPFLDSRIFTLHREILEQQRQQCARISKAFNECIAPENEQLASALIQWYQGITKATESGEFVELILGTMSPSLPPPVSSVSGSSDEIEIKSKKKSRRKKKNNRKNKKRDESFENRRVDVGVGKNKTKSGGVRKNKTRTESFENHRGGAGAANKNNTKSGGVRKSRRKKFPKKKKNPTPSSSSS